MHQDDALCIDTQLIFIDHIVSLVLWWVYVQLSPPTTLSLSLSLSLSHTHTHCTFLFIALAIFACSACHSSGTLFFILTHTHTHTHTHIRAHAHTHSHLISMASLGAPYLLAPGAHHDNIAYLSMVIATHKHRNMACQKVSILDVLPNSINKTALNRRPWKMQKGFTR